MADSTVVEGKEFSFLWELKNFRYCLLNNDRIESPTFTAPQFYNSTWFLSLVPKDEDDDEECASCYVHRVDGDDGPEKIAMKYKLLYNFVLIYEGENTFSFADDEYSHFLPGDLNCLYENSVLIECRIQCCDMPPEYRSKMDYFIPRLLRKTPIPEILNEVLRPLSHKKKEDIFAYPWQCLALSEIIVERIFAVWPIDISIINGNSEKQIIPIFYEEKHPLIITLCINNEDYLEINVHFIHEKIKNPLLLACKVQIIDSKVIALNSLKNEYIFELKQKQNDLNLENTFKVDDLKRIINSSSSSQLKLSFQFVLSFGDITSDIKWIECSDYLGDCSNFGYQMGSVSAQVLDFYNEKKFCDIVVQTKNKRFDVHKIVLCASSPVLSAMFSNELMESKSNRVDIDDVDDDILSQLIDFLYEGTVNNMEFENLRELYVVADKYQISSLKNLCRNFFLSNVSVETVCALLSLADERRDTILENSAVKFIAAAKNDILRSRQWTLFEKEQTVLSQRILKEVCIILPPIFPPQSTCFLPKQISENCT